MSANGKFVEANGLNIYYEEYGSGKPLVLLHGGLIASSSWQPSIPAFSEHFRVIALDSRGHGRTVNPHDSLSYRQMADDTAAFSQALGLEKPYCVGWSDGGQIALELGMNYPDLAGALVVGAAWYKLTAQYRDSVKLLGFEAPGSINEAALNDFLDNYGAREEFESAHHQGEGHLMKLAKQLSVPFLTELGYSADDFKKIIAPTLILIGDRDALVPLEQTFEMYRQIPNAELSVSQNTGHGFPITHNAHFNALVLEFLLRHSAEQS